MGWIVGVRDGGGLNARLHRLCSGDVSGLLRVIEGVRLRGSERVVCGYEAGRDGFWLARYLGARGIDCVVLDPASLPVERRARRTKSDRLDVHLLLRGLMGLAGGERGACRVVRVPSRAAEDVRQVHREREALLRERVCHVNRIKVLLAAQGIDGFEPLRDGAAALAGLRDSEGRPLAPHLRSRLEREGGRLAVVVEQIAAVEATRDALAARQAGDSGAAKVRRLAALKGIGVQTTTVLTREVLWRDFTNRRQLGGYVGLTPTPWRSGGMVREQGIGKAGNARARTALIELAWLWLRWQPDSALTRWFHSRVGTATGRVRRIAIVALARKLAVALWRYVHTGLVPDGAVLKA